MKKYLITIVLISVLALSACGENKDSANKDRQDDKNTHKTAKEDTETEHHDDHQKFGFKEEGDSEQSAESTQGSETQSQGGESEQQGSSAEVKDTDFEMEPGDPSYEDYKEAQKSQYALDHPTPEEKASGAGGGGAGWNYADQDESYEDYVERVRIQKAAAGEN
ncbi:hypothetical protein [Staphylococcus argensis]|uniref:Lipoprotein n=1 Tax=Staphylococcus argensis TaxID=1607738 RepID=A0A2K4FAU4_9STAP|nr:hypothetical protein [Staphylococcus argensis]MCY6991353.1 hypothetical protein [Staphylococcus argensis]POA08411.1 hypothetical protein CD039_10030 [Staphylococcus argensis]